MTPARRLKTVAAGAALALLLLAAPATAHHKVELGDYEVTEFTVRADEPGTAFGDSVDRPGPDADPVVSTLTRAGAHPDLKVRMRFCDPGRLMPQPPPIPPLFDQACNTKQSFAQLRSFTLHLPPGLLGNPEAVRPCPTHLFLVFACSYDSVLGHSLSLLSLGGPKPAPTPVFRVETLGLEPARLGTGRLPISPPGPAVVTVSVRTTGDYGIDSVVTDIPGAEFGPVMEINTLLCARAPCESTDPIDYETIHPLRPLPEAKPFFVNPTSCDKPAQASVDVLAYHRPEVVSPPNVETAQNNETQRRVPQTGNTIVPSRAPAFTPTECDSVPFSPDVTVTPDSPQAGAATGYTVAIQYPRSPLGRSSVDPQVRTGCLPLPEEPTCTYENEDIWQSALKNADVMLPDGVSLSPGGGAGLEACSAEQFGVVLGPDGAVSTNDDPARCPNGSQIGTVKVTTPVLPTPLDGKAFFGPTSAPGRPTPDRPWRLFLLLEGHGLRIKLVGNVSVNENGQVRTRFVNQPEVPFSRFELHTNGGPNAPLANPTTCTTHTGTAVLDGYNGGSVTRQPTVTPTGCADPQPFQPTVDEASAIPTQAGAFSVSRLVMSRPDGHQLLRRFNLSLPAGAAGSLANVPLCPRDRAAVGDCGSEHKVGNVKTTLGTGDGLLTTSGSIFIGEPVQAGDAASFVAVVPAKVGPIDLGRVVAVNRVRLRPSDTGVDVFAADLPTMLEGVPLAIRRLEITVDRESFFFNPTGCDPRTFSATFFSDQGLTATSSVSLAATGCDSLPFNPKLRIIAGDTGLTKKDSHPPLKAIVTQAPGEASIARARVVVPDIIRPNVPQIQKPGVLCSDAQLAARACPALSEIGSALVITPVLPFTLSGPVHIVLRAGSPLPNLVMFLRGGGFEVVLTATNGFEGIKILNEFPTVPDVPQSRFELNVKGGSSGILNAFSDLCKTRPLPTISARFTGHNGKVVSSKPQIEADGCVGAASAGASIASRSVRVTKRGIASIRVRCRQTERCKGRLSLRRLGRKSFSIRAGRSKIVKVKLSRKEFRSLRRRKRMRVRVTARIANTRVRRTITLMAPRR